MVRRTSRRPAIRGLMMDAARLTERHEFYFDMLEKLARWGFNVLWWHFVDDEGFVLKLDSHPELASPYAFTKSETRRLIAAGKEFGIDVVPEVETLGHGRYVTHLPQYAHLADGDPNRFNAICPSHRQTLPLMKDIIREVAELFDSEYFHAGLDEVNLSGCPRCRRRARGKPPWWIYAEHAKAIHRIVTGCGKRMIMWADHVERNPALLKALPKDIVMAHWQYREVRGEQIERSLRAGFEVICCPAMLRHGHVILPHSSAADNTERMIATARRLRGRGVLGAVNTWWTTWRIIRDAALPMAHYTAHLLAGGKRDRTAAMDRFLREQFGVRSKAAARALWTLHEAVPQSAEMGTLLFDNLGGMAQAAAMAGGAEFSARAEALASASKTLIEAAPKVKRDAPAFNALVLGGRVAAGCFENGLDLRRAHASYGTAAWIRNSGDQTATVARHLDEAAGILEGMEGRLAILCKQVSDEWDRTRHPRDPKKAMSDLTAPCQHDVLSGRLARGQRFLEQTVRRFRRSVAAYRRGGPFPGGL